LTKAFAKRCGCNIDALTHPKQKASPVAIDDPVCRNQSECFQPTIEISTELIDAHRVQITIADKDPGMTENVRKQLFHPFFTTKAVVKGTGLGLSIPLVIKLW